MRADAARDQLTLGRSVATRSARPWNAPRRCWRAARGAPGDAGASRPAPRPRYPHTHPTWRLLGPDHAHPASRHPPAPAKCDTSIASARSQADPPHRRSPPPHLQLPWTRAPTGAAGTGRASSRRAAAGPRYGSTIIPINSPNSSVSGRCCPRNNRAYTIPNAAPTKPSAVNAVHSPPRAFSRRPSSTTPAELREDLLTTLQHPRAATQRAHHTHPREHRLTIKERQGSPTAPGAPAHATQDPPSPPRRAPPRSHQGDPRTPPPGNPHGWRTSHRTSAARHATARRYPPPSYSPTPTHPPRGPPPPTTANAESQQPEPPDHRHHARHAAPRRTPAPPGRRDTPTPARAPITLPPRPGKAHTRAAGRAARGGSSPRLEGGARAERIERLRLECPRAEREREMRQRQAGASSIGPQARRGDPCHVHSLSKPRLNQLPLKIATRSLYPTYTPLSARCQPRSALPNPILCPHNHPQG